jgi:hypothetical protein
MYVDISCIYVTYVNAYFFTGETKVCGQENEEGCQGDETDREEQEEEEEVSGLF